MALTAAIADTARRWRWMVATPPHRFGVDRHQLPSAPSIRTRTAGRRNSHQTTCPAKNCRRPGACLQRHARTHRDSTAVPARSGLSPTASITPCRSEFVDVPYRLRSCRAGGIVRPRNPARSGLRAARKPDRGPICSITPWFITTTRLERHRLLLVVGHKGPWSPVHCNALS